MKDGTFEAYGSRDYEYISDGIYSVPYDESRVISNKPPEKSDLEKEVSQLKQDVSQLKTALKAVMDLLSKHSASNHPLY